MKHRIYDENGKFVSVRMCVSCRQYKKKDKLFRIVKSKGGEVSVDSVGSMHGRGAYVCKNTECIEHSRKIRGLERGLKGKVPNEIYEELLEFEE